MRKKEYLMMNGGDPKELLPIYKNRFKSVITYTKAPSKKQTEVVIKFSRKRYFNT
ncbi:hypothetical protein [Campylobacter concisus]|uniref:hypothetical protein n=1 Tax=Campylobacter concisus TaxID=199 RepID=UPI0015E15D99|nr:hypothetical protein [Campylobacter concisus]